MNKSLAVDNNLLQNQKYSMTPYQKMHINLQSESDRINQMYYCIFIIVLLQ